MTDPIRTTPSTSDTTGHAGSDTAAKLKDKAQDAAGKMSAEMTDKAEQTRSGAARNVKDMAAAMHSAAGELDDGTSSRRVFDMIGDNLEQVSDALQHKDMGEMMRDLNALARRHPVAFLGGAALIGFAATRLMTASSPSHARGTAASGTAAGDTDRTSPTTPGTRTGTTGV